MIWGNPYLNESIAGTLAEAVELSEIPSVTNTQPQVNHINIRISPFTKGFHISSKFSFSISTPVLVISRLQI